MPATHRLLAISAALSLLSLAQHSLAQPWGDRGSYGDRGSSGSFRGPEGYRGGFPGGGFPGGGFPGGGFPGGGFPGGGFPGGGFGDPREMVRRADTNNNNMLEPDELQNGYGRPVRYMAERAGLNINQALRVDEVVSAIERSRGMSPSSSSSSGSSPTTTVNPQNFGTPTQVGLVPGFDGVAGLTGAAGSTAQSNLPLEQRFDERILDRAKDRMREYDRDNNGFIDGDELANYRGDPPILTSDLNKDNKINLEEMAARYQARYGGSSSAGYPGSGYPGSSGYPGNSSYSSSSGYRPPFPPPGGTMITTPSSPYSSSSSYRPPVPPSSSTSASSSSSSNDRFREFAQRILSSNDRNNSGKLEKDEWGGLRDGGENTDTNRDGVITVDELTARMAARMSGGPGFGERGSGDRGGDRSSYGDRGSSDRDRGGSDRDRSSYGDRGSFGPPGGPGGPGGPMIVRGPGGPGSLPGPGGPSSPGGPGGVSGDRNSYRGPGGPSGSTSSGGSSSRGPGSSGYSSSRRPDPTAPKTSYRVTTAQELLPQGLDSWFTRSDTDGDGQVSMSEYAAKWDPEVAKKFQQLDANGDGFITANEALRSAPSSSSRR